MCLIIEEYSQVIQVGRSKDFGLCQAKGKTKNCRNKINLENCRSSSIKYEEIFKRNVEQSIDFNKIPQKSSIFGKPKNIKIPEKPQKEISLIEKKCESQTFYLKDIVNFKSFNEEPKLMKPYASVNHHIEYKTEFEKLLDYNERINNEKINQK